MAGDTHTMASRDEHLILHQSSRSPPSTQQKAWLKIRDQKGEKSDKIKCTYGSDFSSIRRLWRRQKQSQEVKVKDGCDSGVLEW